MEVQSLSAHPNADEKLCFVCHWFLVPTNEKKKKRKKCHLTNEKSTDKITYTGNLICVLMLSPSLRERSLLNTYVFRSSKWSFPEGDLTED